MATIPLQMRAEAPATRSSSHDTAYRWFIAASLATAIGGGFALAIIVSLAGALEAGWRVRTLTLVQAHGQLQLLGFAGTFIAGMALRLMPRFSGHRLSFGHLVHPTLILLAGGAIVRAGAQPMTDSAARDAGVILSAVAVVAGSCAFALIVLGTLMRPGERPNATSLFFGLGALFLVVGSILNLSLSIDMVREARAFASPTRQMALTFIWQGFTVMFISGVATRAIPTLTGRPRPERSAQIAAFTLALGVALFAGGTLMMASGGASDGRARLASTGLIIVAASFLAVVHLSGVFHPRANRVAAASQQTFWFIRSAMMWLAVSAALLAWYGVRGVKDGELPDQFALDAVRHALALGVITMMIVGMGLLILPEFAGRRLQHPNESALSWGMLSAANLAVALRLWPSLEGIDWLETTRYWPMAIAGILAQAVIVIYAAMFAQSYFEQRHPGWSQRA